MGLLSAAAAAVLYPFGVRRRKGRGGRADDGDRPTEDEEVWEVNPIHLLGASTAALATWWALGRLRSPSSPIADASPGPVSSAITGALPRIPLSEFFRLLQAGAVTAVTYLSDRPPAGALVVKATLPLAMAAAPQLAASVSSPAGAAATSCTAETLLLPGCHQKLFEELRLCKDLRLECAEVGEADSDFNKLSLLIDAGGLLASVAALAYLLCGSPTSLFSGKRMEEAAADKDRRPTVNFDDVAGMETTKEELREVISFLRNPSGFYALGARPPRGLLLAGPSGTGKTLLARAVAGEAGVPFLYASAAAFVEVFVGQGAQRIRQFFEQARACAPCIVFLDELDAVGASRQYSGGGGGNQEYAQTLNQLLLELDGIETHSSSSSAEASQPLVVTIAATNRYDCLDEALVRPGRLDRIVTVGLPNREERAATLRIHARRLRVQNLDYEELARRTEGKSGADLANTLNEAALLAARRGAEAVGMEHVLQVMGTPRPAQRGQAGAEGMASGPDNRAASGQEFFASMLAAAAAVASGQEQFGWRPAQAPADSLD